MYQAQCPINFYSGNIIHNVDKSFWALYDLQGEGYDCLSNKQRLNLHWKTAQFLAEFKSEAQIWIIPMEENLKKRYGAYQEGLDRDDCLYDTALTILGQTEEYLDALSKANGAINDYKIMIAVKLQQSSDEFETAKETLAYLFRNPVNAVNEWMNLDAGDILKSKMEQCKALADRWLENANYRFHLRECTAAETQWMLHRMKFRGLDQETGLWYKSQDKSKVWEPAVEARAFKKGSDTVYRSRPREIENLFDGQVIPRHRYLEVHTDKTVSYQAFLALTEMPDDFSAIGNEWIYLLQKLNYKTEVCIHIKVKGYRQSLKAVSDKKQEITSQINHVAMAGEEIPDELIEGKSEGNHLNRALKKTRNPLLYTTVSLCVAAGSKEEMERRVDKVKALYSDLTMVVEQPVADQWKLFLSFIPSVGITVKDYVLRLSSDAVASGVLFCTRRLGDDSAQFIGTTGAERKNVFLDMRNACLHDKSASAAFFGNLGFGKSFNANVLWTLNIIHGGYGLIIDPKGERSHWKEQLKILKGLINVVTLSTSDKDAGKLDPYNIYRDDLPEANRFAYNIITELYKIAPSTDMDIALQTAQAKMLHLTDGRIPSMNLLADLLEEFDRKDTLYEYAKKLARVIRLQKDSGMSRLLFGYGTEETVALDNRANILQIQNLNLPQGKEKKEYTQEELLSTVIFSSLCQFAKKFALQRLGAFKLILCDESWALKETAEGRELVNFLSRMGRSLFAGTILNGHSVLDLPDEKVRNTITYKFMFHTDNEEEATRMLKFLRLEPSSENIQRIYNLKNRQCLFQDEEGRAGVLTFDAVFQDFIDVFSTTPKESTPERGDALTEDTFDDLLKKEAI